MARFFGYGLTYVAPGLLVSGFAGWYLSSLWVAATIFGLYAIACCLVEAGVSLIELDDEMREQLDREGDWYDY